MSSGLSQIIQTTQGGSTTNFIYGIDRLAAESGGMRTWYVGDALGSVRQTLTDSGAVLGTASYDPWGVPQGNSIAPFGFTGELQQGGNVYLRARWYTPASGTFTARDPFAGWATQPDSLHPYTYTGNNPVNRLDPSGRWWWGAGHALFESSRQRFQNQNIHIRIQALAMAGRESYVHAEYAGAGLSIDLLDLAGEIWEIKPWDEAEQGLVEAIQRVDAMNIARDRGLLQGRDPFGRDYNWNASPLQWELGTSFPSGEHHIGVATEGAWIVDIYAEQTEPGLILWWKHNRRRGDQVPYPILLPRGMVWNERNTRPGWQPQPQPVPVFAASPSDILTVCLYGVGIIAASAATIAIAADPIPGDEALIPLIWTSLAAAR